jgi:proteic killer suppression protein
MDISFANDKLKRQLSNEKSLKRAFGDRARRLQLRLDLLKAAGCLDDVLPVPPPRRHELTGDWRGHFAVDLTGNWRLIFRPNHDPVPVTPDGGVDLKAITAIIIVAVEDYH